MPISSDLWAGRNLCSFMRKGTQGKLPTPKLHHSTGTNMALCLHHSSAHLPYQHCPSLLISKTKQKFLPTRSSTSLSGHLSRGVWGSALRGPGQHTLEGPPTCDLQWKEFWALCPWLMSKRSTRIENWVGDPVNKQEEIRFGTAFVAWLNGEPYLGKSYTKVQVHPCP
jgi:hypothetical protein